MGKSPRLVYLDWMRGLAILLMLQGHSFHSWLRDDLRGSDLFQLSQLAAGLPAPLFLFLTGFSLVILLDRSERGGDSGRQRWLLVLRRAGYIFLMAMLFRLQLWAFYWPHAPARGLLKVDILNTMAVALALSGAMALLAAPRLRMAAAAACAVGAAMATPLVWSLPQDALPFFLLDYLKGSVEMASFPLFPWMSYAFTGVLAGLALAGEKERSAIDRQMQWMVVVALVLLVAARFFDALPYSYYQPYNYWLTSPNLVANKTAVVLLLLAACYAWSHQTDPLRFSCVRQLGQTSLLIYWVHIELVYGRFLGFLQHRLDIPRTITAIVLLIAAMLLLSLVKTRWARRRREITRALPAGPEAVAKPGGGD